jgi:broad specificity phosphatase PhoE
MTRILLVRHATNDLLGRILYGRTSGVHLNEEGMRQAQALARFLLERYVISEVVSSPMERALETAAPICELQKVPLTVDERITEIDVGSWTGKSFEELRECQGWRSFNRHRSLHWPPDGETMPQVQDRAWRAIMAAAQRFSQGDVTIAFVTHGDVVRCTLMLLLGMPVDYIHRLEISPASVTEVQIANDVTNVYSINQLLDRAC